MALVQFCVPDGPDKGHRHVERDIRIWNLQEEVGEVADAFIGMQGLNGRKGVCRTRDDLLAELADVIITAAVAMSVRSGPVPRPVTGRRACRMRRT